MLNVRRRQYVPYTKPTALQLPPGDYLAVDTLDRQLTSNQACWNLWDVINGEAQTLSARPSALQPVITKDLLRDAIEAINRCFVQTTDRVVTRANRTFTDTFGGPAPYSFEPYPIRWAGENREALQIILSFVSAAYQIPQVRSNHLDNGIIDSHAKIIVEPLFALKADLMKRFFQIEPKGEISPDELDAIFRDGGIRPPLAVSLTDTRDTPADLAAEDARALTDESSRKPTPETLARVQDGQDVWKWVPTTANYLTAAEVLRRLEVSGPSQRPTEPFPFSTEVIAGTAKVTKKTAKAAGARTE